MSKQSKIWGWLIGAACIGCCAVPLYLLVVGGAAIGITSWFSPAWREILMCLLPLMAVALIFYFMKRKKSCCDTPGNGCSSNQCGLDHQ